jgi:glycosyltransferase involved in cell wall biosynthesis
MSRVSAIVPTYQRRRELERAVNSALRQTHPLHELIVIDDGSSDGTAQYLAELARHGAPSGRIVVHTQSNRGPSAARNAGLRLARGDFIAFLDDDDSWHPEKTSRQLALFHSRPELALVGCVSAEMKVFARQAVVPIGTERLLRRNYLLTPGVMARRDVLVASGGFAEDMRYCEDYDLWLRIAGAHPCALLNEVLMVCGDGKPPFGDAGLSANLWAVQAGELEAFRRWRRRGGSALKHGAAQSLSWMRFLRRLVIVATRRAAG